jgi:hypothetical protein
LVFSDYENELLIFRNSLQNNFEKKIFIEKIQKILDSECQLRYSKPRKEHVWYIVLISRKPFF